MKNGAGSARWRNRFTNLSNGVEPPYPLEAPPNKKKGVSGTFQERVKLELLVDDSEAEKVVNVILWYAQPESDEEGGHIAVPEISETLRIGRLASRRGALRNQGLAAWGSPGFAQ